MTETIPRKPASIWLNLIDRMNEADKRQHIGWSFWLTVVAAMLWPLPWAVTQVFAIGLAKECWDHRYGSGFCPFDLLGNLLGIAAALAFIGLAPNGLYAS